jgi:diketogulonate reductase-like aldo/keto reductase
VGAATSRKRSPCGSRATTAQIALAWALRQPDVMLIPKAAMLEHVRENWAALDIRLTD